MISPAGKMRNLSILGDSLSTFENYNPPGYAVYYDKAKQEENGIESVQDTWWAKVIKEFHACLCINNSYSGSRVTGKEFPAAHCNERISNLKSAIYEPEIILVMIGFNDFANGISIYKKDDSFTDDLNVLIFEEAYHRMLRSIIKNHPMAMIVCSTLMRTKIKNRTGWTFPESYGGIRLEAYNDCIRNCCCNICYA